jgi:hypothetical protein
LSATGRRGQQLWAPKIAEHLFFCMPTPPGSGVFEHLSHWQSGAVGFAQRIIAVCQQLAMLSTTYFVHSLSRHLRHVKSIVQNHVFSKRNQVLLHIDTCCTHLQGDCYRLLGFGALKLRKAGTSLHDVFSSLMASIVMLSPS